MYVIKEEDLAPKHKLQCAPEQSGGSREAIHVVERSQARGSGDPGFGSSYAKPSLEDPEQVPTALWPSVSSPGRLKGSTTQSPKSLPALTRSPSVIA